MTVGTVDSTSTAGTGSVGSGSAEKDYLSGFPSAVKALRCDIDAAAAKSHVDPKLIASVILAESGGDPAILNGTRRSSAGAIGAMQLMPATARQLGVQNPCNVADNIQGGAEYLRELLVTYNGDVRKAVMAYNAGPGNVNNGRAETFSETRNYATKVLGAFNGQVSMPLARVANLAGAPGSRTVSIGGGLATWFQNLRNFTFLEQNKSLNDLASDVAKEHQARGESVTAERVRQELLKINPELKDLDVIPAGTRVNLPILSAAGSTDFDDACKVQVELVPTSTLTPATPSTDPSLKVKLPIPL